MARRRRSARRDRRLMIALIAVILLLTLTLGGLLVYFLVFDKEEAPGVVGGQREAAALKGSLAQMTEEEIQAELDKIIEEGMFRITIASQIAGYEGGEYTVNIENHMTNRYVMQVSIYLDETGEEIYATDLIDPGYYIEHTTFDKPLPAGRYQATAIFTALYPDTEEIVGTAGANVKIISLPVSPTPTPTVTPTPEPTATPSPVP